VLTLQKGFPRRPVFSLERVGEKSTLTQRSGSSCKRKTTCICDVCAFFPRELSAPPRVCPGCVVMMINEDLEREERGRNVSAVRSFLVQTKAHLTAI
jgi:hypothetical protein